METATKATAVRQVGQHADDLDASVAFYVDLLGGEFLGKFDPPGLALVRFGDVRVLLEHTAPPAILYLEVPDIDRAFRDLSGAGVVFEDAPHLVHRDDSGLFGSPGGEEWMVFLRDPAGALVALIERRNAKAAG